MTANPPSRARYEAVYVRFARIETGWDSRAVCHPTRDELAKVVRASRRPLESHNDAR
jgi:hypothetical protein